MVFFSFCHRSPVTPGLAFFYIGLFNCLFICSRQPFGGPRAGKVAMVTRSLSCRPFCRVPRKGRSAFLSVADGHVFSPPPEPYRRPGVHRRCALKNSPRGHRVGFGNGGDSRLSALLREAPDYICNGTPSGPYTAGSSLRCWRPCR